MANLNTCKCSSRPLNARLSTAHSLSAKLSVGNVTPDMRPTYSGPIDAIPTLEDQVLPTKDTIVKSDILVHKIPSHAVSNSAGGVTFSIGG